MCEENRSREKNLTEPRSNWRKYKTQRKRAIRRKKKRWDEKRNENVKEKSQRGNQGVVQQRGIEEGECVGLEREKREREHEKRERAKRRQSRVARRERRRRINAGWIGGWKGEETCRRTMNSGGRQLPSPGNVLLPFPPPPSLRLQAVMSWYRRQSSSWT